jgi:hypothetical protein
MTRCHSFLTLSDLFILKYWTGVQIIKLFIMQSLELSVNFAPLCQSAPLKHYFHTLDVHVSPVKALLAFKCYFETIR